MSDSERLQPGDIVNAEEIDDMTVLDAEDGQVYVEFTYRGHIYKTWVPEHLLELKKVH